VAALRANFEAWLVHAAKGGLWVAVAGSGTDSGFVEAVAELQLLDLLIHTLGVAVAAMRGSGTGSGTGINTGSGCNGTGSGYSGSGALAVAVARVAVLLRRHCHTLSADPRLTRQLVFRNCEVALRTATATATATVNGSGSGTVNGPGSGSGSGGGVYPAVALRNPHVLPQALAARIAHDGATRVSVGRHCHCHCHGSGSGTGSGCGGTGSGSGSGSGGGSGSGTVAVAALHRPDVTVYDADTLAPLFVLTGHTLATPATATATSPTATSATATATASASATATATAGVTCVAHSPDGRLLATGGADGSVRVWVAVAVGSGCWWLWLLWRCCGCGYLFIFCCCFFHNQTMQICLNKSVIFSALSAQKSSIFFGAFPPCFIIFDPFLTFLKKTFFNLFLTIFNHF
jgi:hypothetical protein